MDTSFQTTCKRNVVITPQTLPDMWLAFLIRALFKQELVQL